MITDPYFYVVAVISVFLLHGMAKGGFAGSFAFISNTYDGLLYTSFPGCSYSSYCSLYLWILKLFIDIGECGLVKEVKHIIPLGILGVIIGTITFKFMSEDHIRILVGDKP